jgi:hypothetical protein
MQMSGGRRVFLEKPVITKLVKKFPAFNEAQSFITVFTGALHLSLSWARWIQSTFSQPIFLRPCLMLSSLLRPGLQSGLYNSGFPTKKYMHICNVWYIPCQSHALGYDLPKNVWRSVAGIKFYIMQYFTVSSQFLL